MKKQNLELQEEWAYCVSMFYKAFSIYDGIEVSVIYETGKIICFGDYWEELQQVFDSSPLRNLCNGMLAEPVPESFEEFKTLTDTACAINLHYKDENRKDKITIYKCREQGIEAIYSTSDEEYRDFFRKTSPC